MVLPRQTRIFLGTLATLLLVLGTAVWVLPVAIADGRLVKRDLHSHHGTIETTEEFLGWGALHSLELAIALFAVGMLVLLLAVLPPGTLKRVSTPVAEIEFGEVVSEIIDVAVDKVPKSEIKDVVPEVLSELSRKRTPLEPSRIEIEETIARVIERDEKS